MGSIPAGKTNQCKDTQGIEGTKKYRVEVPQH